MKRIVLLFLIISLVLAFTIFTGCVKPTISKGTTSETKVEETAATTVETTVEKKKFEGLSLILWEIPSLPKAFDLLVEGFENETGAKIERIGVPAPSEQAILQKWAAGERPDILNWHPLPNWFLQLRPEETLIDLSNEEFVKKTINNYLDGQTELNGKYYGPILIEPYLWGMWYSKEVFNRVGINMPEDTPVGYTGLLEMYKKIKDAGETPLFMGGGDQWPLQVFPGLMWLEAFGDTDLWNELNTNKAMWTDERIITGISKLKE
ncbi:MAG: extracellular solute-binding protein, partial [Actinobacteria bacterium]|nr:extracellular solute-binding protein [Actinomycetota bacterium]